MSLAAVPLLMTGLACSRHCAGDIAYKSAVQKALAKAGVAGVSVEETVSSNVITLSGTAPTENARQEASNIAQGAAGPRVISNDIRVLPSGGDEAARQQQARTDDGIERNFHAVLVAKGLDRRKISADAQNGVLVLKGNVESAPERHELELLAQAVPDVQQVVNRIEVRR